MRRHPPDAGCGPDDVRFLWFSGPGSFVFALSLSLGLSLDLSLGLTAEPHSSAAVGILILVAWGLAYVGGAVAFVFWLALLACDREFRRSWRVLLLGIWFAVAIQPVLFVAFGMAPSRMWLDALPWGLVAAALGTAVSSFWPRRKKRCGHPV